MFQYRLTLRLRLTTAIHLKHSQILTKYYYIIKLQYALTVRCYCMLNYLWVVTVFAKRLLTNTFFLFRKDSCYSRHMVTFPRISKLRLLRDVNFVGKAESWWPLTFLSVLSHIGELESLLQSFPWPRERRSVVQRAQHVNKEPGCNGG